MSRVKFPSLEIRPDDVASSWQDFYDGFRIASILAEAEMGKDGDGAKKFTAQLKLMTLLNQIGSTGRKTLAAEGLTLETEDLSYDKAIEVLRKHYEKTDSLYVKTQKFVTVRQCAGEDYGSYLLRVEKLSRELSFFEHDTKATRDALQEARTNLALVLAVNGIRDSTLCRELIAKDDLTWKSLGTVLRARDTAEVSIDKLGGEFHNKASVSMSGSGATGSPVRIKQEPNDISYVRSREGREHYQQRGNQRSRSNSRDSQGRRSSGSNSNSEKGHASGTRYRYGSDSYDKSQSKYYTSPSQSPNRTYRQAQGYSPNQKMSRQEGCYECGGRGHYARTCPKIKCRTCHSQGHMARDCGRSSQSSWRSEDRPYSSRPKRSPTPHRSSRENYVQFVDDEYCDDYQFSS